MTRKEAAIQTFALLLSAIVDEASAPTYHGRAVIVRFLEEVRVFVEAIEQSKMLEEILEEQE